MSKAAPAARGSKIVRPWQKGLIERLGKYQRTADSGLSLILPFLERMIKVTEGAS